MNEQNRNITYNIHLSSGGNFNQSIEGPYLQVHGNVNISQDLSQAAVQIQELLRQLENQGYHPQDAQQKVAKDWVNEIKKNPQEKGKLIKLGQSIRDASASAVIGETTVGVIKLVFALLGIPLPF
ncbi:hypothetical protein A0J48_011245 [Sphaerospermopsis aphanizomenoides BCCUSP55]|uniref:hypothetical protein n=1 Tax=Sphaerospermopsis aphanizomenoides TaxID=459663 RepID=UPI001903945B|nr:hypothetical protein [Sphaerospermopsis aphanizomenoides]MBK1988106.1 hypothetical protein [Sphaerospermopsis aphanizomenoides BCCUSP55]